MREYVREKIRRVKQLILRDIILKSEIKCFWLETNDYEIIVRVVKTHTNKCVFILKIKVESPGMVFL